MEFIMKFGLVFVSSVGFDLMFVIEVVKCVEVVGFEFVWGGEYVIIFEIFDFFYFYIEDGKLLIELDIFILDLFIWLVYVVVVVFILKLGICILILL